MAPPENGSTRRQENGRATRTAPDYSREAAAGCLVAGVDEAGRGPLAGPVVAAAVILDAVRVPDGLADSKLLEPARREALFATLDEAALVGVGMASVGEIDRLNILRATMLAMGRAVRALPRSPELALVDGNRRPRLGCPVECIVDGDALCASIAAASIVAKVTRDRLMTELAARHPRYGWERNFGYGTPEHLTRLREHGPCRHHRKSFAPVRELLQLGLTL